MNKKYNILIAIMVFLSSSQVFAAQNVNMKQYSLTVAAYESGYLKDIATHSDLWAVREHKEMLETRKKSIESSFIPALLRIIAYGLSSISIAGFGVALYGSIGSYFLLNQSESPSDIARLGYFDYLKYEYGLEKGQLFNLRGQHTAQSIGKSPELQKNALRAGIIAPPLAGGSLVIGAISALLFRTAASYKEEATRLEELIQRDNAILKVLGVAVP